MMRIRAISWLLQPWHLPWAPGRGRADIVNTETWTADVGAGTTRDADTGTRERWSEMIGGQKGEWDADAGRRRTQTR